MRRRLFWGVVRINSRAVLDRALHSAIFAPPKRFRSFPFLILFIPTTDSPHEPDP